MRGLSAAVWGGLTILTLGPLVSAKSGFGEACNPNNTHLDTDTWALDSDCDATTWCDSSNDTCAYRGCRHDIYPYGYNGVPFTELPPLCPSNQFCPDEGSGCLDLVPVNGTCQKDRDDECELAPNWHDLSGYLNVNGSICLNYVCYWANVTLGQTCVYENTPYTAYTDSGSEYAFVVSRDNCANGLYCDVTSSQCLKGKAIGKACAGNKECISYNCENNAVCGRAVDEPITPSNGVYAGLGVGIAALIGGVMVTLWLFHRRSRTENQVKLEQYYNEQIAYRQSIMSMSHAKNSLLSLPVGAGSDAAQRTLQDDSFGASSATDAGLLPPNMRRDSDVWSNGGSEELLVTRNQQQGQSQLRHDRGGRF